MELQGYPMKQTVEIGSFIIIVLQKCMLMSVLLDPQYQKTISAYSSHKFHVDSIPKSAQSHLWLCSRDCTISNILLKWNQGILISRHKDFENWHTLMWLVFRLLDSICWWYFGDAKSPAASICCKIELHIKFKCLTI